MNLAGNIILTDLCYNVLVKFNNEFAACVSY